MPEVSFLSPKAVEQLREIARRVLREEIGSTTGRPGRQHDTPAVVYVGKTSGSITGRSTDTAGTGSMTLYYLSTANVLTVGSTNIVTVKNMTTSTITSGTYIQCKQDVYGTLWVDVEACATASETLLALST